MEGEDGSERIPAKRYELEVILFVIRKRNVSLAVSKKSLS